MICVYYFFFLVVVVSFLSVKIKEKHHSNADVFLCLNSTLDNIHNTTLDYNSEQLYKDLIHYLTTLTFLDGLTDKRKTHIRRISTQYISKNNILYRNTKEGIRKVILPEQVELILYHLLQQIL